MATQDIEFCTLGMFIIDEIHPAKSAQDAKPQLDVIGGAGTYSAIGARLFSPAPQSASVGWIVDAGNDFPPGIRDTILSWQTGVLFRRRDGLTTRGWNGYGDNDFRAFKYLTEKKRITTDDLTPPLLQSKSFHLICAARRCSELVSQVTERRKEYALGAHPRPLFIWEPVPDLCVPDEMENIKTALHIVDVVSPNHDELATLFDFKHCEHIDTGAVETQAHYLLESGIGRGGTGAIVVRCGKYGTYVATNLRQNWLPAYHQNQSDVVDPTGGGNGFLGGFAVGLVRTGDLVSAALWGAIAASFCIEQIGLPTLESINSHERWNGCDVLGRLKQYTQGLTPMP